MRREKSLLLCNPRWQPGHDRNLGGADGNRRFVLSETALRQAGRERHQNHDARQSRMQTQSRQQRVALHVVASRSVIDFTLHNSTMEPRDTASANDATCAKE